MSRTVRRPLEDMLVLDPGQIYNGPYCALLLAFMGARVIKIEPPEGDVLRRRKRHVEPYPLVMLNSNKESVVLDLKHPQAPSCSSASWPSPMSSWRTSRRA
jgi:CoA:oxalate CoA-transferase